MSEIDWLKTAFAIGYPAGAMLMAALYGAELAKHPRQEFDGFTLIFVMAGWPVFLPFVIGAELGKPKPAVAPSGVTATGVSDEVPGMISIPDQVQKP